MARGGRRRRRMSGREGRRRAPRRGREAVARSRAERVPAEEGEGMTPTENSSGTNRSTDRDVQVRPRTAGAAAATAKNGAAVEVVAWSRWMKTTIRRRRST
ncbi:unnamed protein product, partial [Ectocarpus sp. 8 AP-2014]